VKRARHEVIRDAVDVQEDIEKMDAHRACRLH
jgi:hypothetical protein